MKIFFLFFFFFSSRRRHTRCSRDWSSDVCSSDLGNSIKGLLAGLGLCVIVDETLPTQLENLRQWDGAKLPPMLHQRLLREFQRWQLIDRQIHELEAERMAKIRDDR